LRKVVFEGDVNYGSLMAGQSAGLVKAILPVKDILAAICEPSLLFTGKIES
jgi:enoyl-[acyl-carrier protein] reductase II